MITHVISMTISFLWISILISVCFLLLECAAAVIGRRRRSSAAESLDHLTVIVAVHNEEAMLPQCLDSLIADGLSASQVVVAADHCTDRSIEIARQYGVHVIEHIRSDGASKGHNLAFALNSLSLAPSSILVFIDGDSWIIPGTLSALVGTVQRTGQPAQASFIQLAQNELVSSRLSAFAFLIKNYVRPYGLFQLGLPCLLFGSGMAFPAAIINVTLLADQHFADDYHLTVKLAELGYVAEFCPNAKVTSWLDSDKHSVSRQRLRWEQGHLSLLNKALWLLWHGLRKRRIDIMAIGFELGIPPLALLTIAIAVLALPSLALGVLNEVLPLQLALISVSLFFISISISWLRFGRENYPLSIFARVPIYILSKVPFYAGLIKNEGCKIMRRV